MTLQAEPSFWTFLQTVDDELLAVAGFFLFVTIIVVVVTMAVTIAVVTRRRIDAALKQDMLDRGMSAEDIAIVIEAKPRPGCSAPRRATHYPREHGAQARPGA